MSISWACRVSDSFPPNTAFKLAEWLALSFVVGDPVAQRLLHHDT
ncbi:hypothetical protein ACPOL_6800 (plasmid) [Acidisarcina polymorpha]|uniref:Uncharacterized protein n=1 Tax=Acidisarcina polymorpha TaxID=2211140 RepID=A0A2Z5GAR8_9BACT|nr:hypothetical protein ACPOL_6800 [Acidisarcina polymorpha]